MAQLLTPRPGSYILDTIQQRLLQPNVDVVDSEDPLVVKYRGKWATPTPGTPAADKKAPTNGAEKAEPAPAAPAPAAPAGRRLGATVATKANEDDD